LAVKRLLEQRRARDFVPPDDLDLTPDDAADAWFNTPCRPRWLRPQHPGLQWFAVSTSWRRC
jgi:hypothetical protein